MVSGVFSTTSQSLSVWGLLRCDHMTQIRNSGHGITGDHTLKGIMYPCLCSTRSLKSDVNGLLKLMMTMKCGHSIQEKPSKWTLSHAFLLISSELFVIVHCECLFWLCIKHTWVFCINLQTHHTQNTPEKSC